MKGYRIVGAVGCGMYIEMYIILKKKSNLFLLVCSLNQNLSTGTFKQYDLKQETPTEPHQGYLEMAFKTNILFDFVLLHFYNACIP